MGDIYERNAHLLLDAFQFDLHILAQLQIQRGQRLVQKQDLGPVHQGAGDGHALLLTTGEGVGLAVLETLEVDDLKHLHDPLIDLLLGDLHLLLAGGIAGIRAALHPQTERDIFVHIQVREQGVLLEDGVDLALIGRNVINPHTVKQDIAGCRRHKAANDPQRGALTASAGS